MKLMAKLDKVICLESVYGLGETTDRDKGKAFGVKVIQVGQVNDARPFKVDEETLQQVVDLGNSPNKGVKVRLTHPQGDGIGSHLGRASNFYIDGDCVRADLSIAKSAKHSPMGTMFEYFFSMAEEDPEALGMSIAAVLNGSEMEPDDAGYAPLRVSKLWAVDVVGDPAATRGGLFHQEDDYMSEEIKLEEELKEEVELAKTEELEDAEPEQVTEDPVEAVEGDEDKPEEEPKAEEEEKEEEKVEQSVAVDQATKEPVPPTETKTLGAEHEAFVEAFGDVGARWFLEGRTLADCFQEKCELQAQQLLELQEKLGDYETRIAALGQSFGEEAPAPQAIELSAEEQKAAEKEAKLSAKKAEGWSGALAGMSSILNG
jgi:hypothetical protein